MPRSIETSLRGRFRTMYRQLKRSRIMDTTPIVFTEGDSWFSTPLAMNIVDWLVHPAPEDAHQAIPAFGQGGLFFRDEGSGDLATDIFSPKKVDRIADWYDGFDFNLVLLSAGGNDFVDDFLKDLFADKDEMDVQEAVDLVKSTGRFSEVEDAYRHMLDRFFDLKPDVPIVTHTYAYPLLLGQPGELTLGNIGLVALLKKEVGDWISRHIRHVLSGHDDQVLFARHLIDNFHDLVLSKLHQDYEKLFVVDVRNTLPNPDDWFDEMHPTALGFHKIASEFRNVITPLLHP